MALIKLNSRAIPDATVTSDDLFSGFANGITQTDQWRLTADITAAGDITSNLERVDEPSFNYIGNGMSESSGIFTFPSTGIWLVMANMRATPVSGDGTIGVWTYVTIDNSSYNVYARSTGGNGGSSAAIASASSQAFVDVTNTSNVKVKFLANSVASGTTIDGNTDTNFTYFTFIRLGDT